MLLTKGCFTAVHCLILSLNAFFDPDIESFLGRCFGSIFPQLADSVMIWIHQEIGCFYNCTRICFHLSSVLKKIGFKSCYSLCIAGCLLHFQIDHIFEENGQDKLY